MPRQVTAEFPAHKKDLVEGSQRRLRALAGVYGVAAWAPERP
ncbi:hypothetical protein N8J89_24055 [Crossiella sp. CA-258035]|nr:hypothetical protein [Crossiella sp. CA-258035]WHT16204.1 hypothetical protein N8J89_24055 [Crossiella sp. CA-258035]